MCVCLRACVRACMRVSVCVRVCIISSLHSVRFGDLRDINSTRLNVLLSHHPTKSHLYFHVLDAVDYFLFHGNV